MSKQKLPVGMDGFEKIHRNGFYYIDKTKLIEQLFLNWGKDAGRSVKDYKNILEVEPL